MHANKQLQPKHKKFAEDGYESPTGSGNVNAEMDDNASNGSSQTDLSDVGLCSLNIHEFNFNIALCYIMAGDYKKAKAKLEPRLVSEWRVDWRYGSLRCVRP